MITAFLNTDALIIKLFGHSRDQATLRDAVARRPVIASWYTLLEYQWTVVHAFLFFRHLLVREASVDDALIAFSSDYRGRVRGLLPMIVRQMGGLTDAYRDREWALDRLAALIRWELPGLARQAVSAFVGVDLWKNYAEAPPTLDLLAFQQALRPELDPALPDLLTSHADAFRRVIALAGQAELAALPKGTELAQVSDLCQRLLADPTALLGHPHLLDRLSDLLIILDAPADAEVLAFDHLFGPLCAAVGKPARVLPSWRRQPNL